MTGQSGCSSILRRTTTRHCYVALHTSKMDSVALGETTSSENMLDDSARLQNVLTCFGKSSSLNAFGEVGTIDTDYVN